MGSCFSCCEDTDKDLRDQAPNERTRLLNNVVSDGPGSSVRQSSYDSPMDPPDNKGDEQSALNKILHETASNVIDVSVMDSQSLEHSEYIERARQYNAKIANSMGHHSKFHSNHNRLPAGVAAPHIVLSGQPVSLADIHLVSISTEAVSKAIKDIKVRHKEDLVVPFGVP